MARMTRRAFMGRALGLGVLAAGSQLAGCAEYAPPEVPLRFFTPKEYATFSALAAELFPARPGRPGAADLELTRLADEIFSTAHPGHQRRVRLALAMLEDYTFLALRFGAFTRMSGPSRRAYLTAVMRSTLGFQRRAFIALNRLIGLLYYADRRSWAAIGFAGPWVGRIDVGSGLNNQGDVKASLNPNVFARFPG